MLSDLLSGSCDPYLAFSWRQLPDLCLPADRVRKSRERKSKEPLHPLHKAIDACISSHDEDVG